jgi:tetratricopeptide (TPR) repeat protein
MKRTLVVLLGALLALLPPPWAPPIAGVAGAAERPALSERTHRRLSAAQELLNRDRPDEAVRALRALHDDAASGYERALVQQTLGYAYLAQGEHEAAAKAFQDALDNGSLPPQAAHPLRYNLAQLHAQAGRYRQAAGGLEHWLAAEPNPPPAAHLLAGQVYFQLKEYGKSIAQVRSAIDKAAAPPEAWYQLLLAAYHEDGQHEAAARLLQEMVAREPDNAAHWRRLADLQLHLGRHREALATLELALRRDLLEGSDRRRLAQLYLYLELPYRAARLLGDALEAGQVPDDAEHWALLGDAWLGAREYARAVAALREAGERTQEAAPFVRAVEILLSQERWHEAAELLDQALERATEDEAPRVQLLAGIAAFHSGEHDRAAHLLSSAARAEATRAQAEAWLGALARATNPHMPER